MRRRRHTLKENVISFLIGALIGLALVGIAQKEQAKQRAKFYRDIESYAPRYEVHVSGVVFDNGEEVVPLRH